MSKKQAVVSTPLPMRRRGESDRDEVRRLRRLVHFYRGLVARLAPPPEGDDPYYKELPY